MRHTTVLEHTVIGRELLGRGWVQALLCAMLCGEIHQHCERVIKSTPGGFPGANIAGQTHTSVQAGYDGVGRQCIGIRTHFAVEICHRKHVVTVRVDEELGS